MGRRAKQQTPKPPQIYAGRQPNRPHHIEAWAEHRGFMNQAALVKATGADKATVSRWYDGASPAREWQQKLCGLFGYPGEPEILFRHPDDDWMARFLKGRTAEERERARLLLETAFPPKRA
jgi:hypothetical protein